jgi:hypothetical protein
VTFRQQLLGGYQPLGEPLRQRPLLVEFSPRQSGLVTLLSPRNFEISGFIDAEALAKRQPLTGTLRLELGSAQLLAEWDFSGDDGRAYKLIAKCGWRFREPLFSLSRITGHIKRELQPAAQVELRFDFRQEMARFVSRCLKLVW